MMTTMKVDGSPLETSDQLFSDAAEFDTAESDDDCSDSEEELLQAARAGDADRIQKIVEHHRALNINCKGQHKWNYQWTPLHLAAYFGHVEAARVLLQKGANPSAPNGDGDTPLHKAALTGREPLVMLLLAHGADVFAVNAEGNAAYDVASELYLKNVLTAAELADKKRKEELFFQAVKDADVAAIQKLLNNGNKRTMSPSLDGQDYDLSLPSPRRRRGRPSRTSALDVNCVDAVGNSALHAAAHRDLRSVAVLLLQCGANPNLRNRRGLTPVDLARSEQMAGILKVAPIREIKNSVTRFEGPVIRKKRFLGTQAVWAVADRGVLSFFANRADASTGSSRKRFHYLEGAVILADPRDERSFTVVSANGNSERLSAATALEKSRWLRALKEHSTFGPSGSLSDGGESGLLVEDQIPPLGFVQNALMTAQAQQSLLASEVTQAARLHTSFLDTSLKEGEFSVRAQNASHLLRAQLARVSESGQNSLSCLETCLLLMKQHEEARTALLAREIEKNRILRETLAAFAYDSSSLQLEGQQDTSGSESLEKETGHDSTQEVGAAT